VLKADNLLLRSGKRIRALQSTQEDPMFEGLFQPMHLMIIAGIALLVFGPKKLPELGKGLGESIRGFKTAMAAKEEVKQKTETETETETETSAHRR
jgi:sec-independent protein translocase protein TatA